ncbi:UNVERIFIED_ORG: hypothetical protein BCL66_102182 [Martelella mediterranea]
MSREQMAIEADGASILLSAILDTAKSIGEAAEGDLAIRVALLAGSIRVAQAYVEKIKIELEGENAEN